MIFIIHIVIIHASGAKDQVMAKISSCFPNEAASFLPEGWRVHISWTFEHIVESVY